MPTYKLLFIWVEGDDDERFFNKVLVPKFLEKYSGVKIIKYAAMRKKKVDNLVVFHHQLKFTSSRYNFNLSLYKS